MDVDADDDATVVQTNRTPKEPVPPLYVTRVTMKIRVPGSNNDNHDPFVEVLKKIKIFQTKGQGRDKYLSFRKWRDSAPDEYTDISNPMDMPGEEDIAEFYFHGLNPYNNNRQQDCWFQARLVHSKELIDIRKEASRWMKASFTVIKENQLQCEDREECFIIINSHGDMCVNQLKADIFDDCGVETQCTYKMAYEGQKKGVRIAENDKKRAIHVEVDSAGWRKSAAILSQRYGSTGTTLPKGRRMRMVPTILKAKSIASKDKVKSALRRQKNFVDIISKGYTSDIILLDTIKINTKGKALPTLREMISKIKSTQPGSEHIPLLHSIDPCTYATKSYGGSYVYTFMPNLEDEAVTMMDNIIPYLRHVYGRTVCKYFDSAAVEACSKDKWDPKTK